MASRSSTPPPSNVSASVVTSVSTSPITSSGCTELFRRAVTDAAGSAVDTDTLSSAVEFGDVRIESESAVGSGVGIECTHAGGGSGLTSDREKDLWDEFAT